MILFQRAWYKVRHPIWWVWYFYIKCPALQLYHRHFPHKHDWHWLWCADCGCCGFEGVSCTICRQEIIIGHNARQARGWSEESGDFEENGY